MINFNSSNWFEEYIDFRRDHPLQPNNIRPIMEGMDVAVLQRFKCLENPLYPMLQHSGLIYGFPVYYPFQPLGLAVGKMASVKKAKLILLDVMMYASLLQKPGFDQSAYQQEITRIARLIQSYYAGIQQFTKDEDEEPELIERLLFKRIRQKKNLLNFKKTGVNSHLFWDLFYFLEYCRISKKEQVNDEALFPQLLAAKKEIKQLTLKLLVAASHANKNISRQEKVLLRQFKRSSKQLNSIEKAELKHIYKTGICLQDIDIPALDWIARRFLLDICLLAIHADAAIDEMEETFLKDLLQKLDLSTDDLLSSKAELGCFLYLYGKKLHFYKGQKVGVFLIGQAIVGNFAKLGHAAKMEYFETVAMANTFGKVLINKLNFSKKGDLPDEEKIKEAFDQLLDLPKFLPFFTIFFLPVPGITELYILLAFTLEKFSKGNISLLPSQMRKILKKDRERKEES